MTVYEIYDQAIKPLSTAERLQLATIILNDIPPQLLVDYREDWSDEDIDDFTRASWLHIDQSVDELPHG